MTQLKEAIVSGENKSRRIITTILAGIGVLVTNGGLPAYTPPKREILDGVLTVVTPGLWEPWPVAVVKYLAVVGVLLTAWLQWKPSATTGLPR